MNSYEFRSFEDSCCTVRVCIHRKSSSEINCLISLAWAEGGIDVGDPMLKIEKCCEGDRAPPTPQKSENKFRVIWLFMKKDSQCIPCVLENDAFHGKFNSVNTFVQGQRLTFFGDVIPKRPSLNSILR